MKWDLVKLDNICEVVGGTTPSTNNPAYWNGNIVWLSPIDLPEVGSINYVSTSRRKITNLGLTECGLRLLPKGSLVFSTRASIGKIGIVQEPLTTNQGFTSLIPGDRINVKYLAYVLKHNIPTIEQLGNSTTFKEVSRTAFRNFRISLPPLHIQKQIADTLDKADALRRKDNELLQMYDKLAQTIFYDMFGDPEQNNKSWITTTLGGLVENKSDLVDGPFGSSVDVKIDYIEDGEIPVIRTKNIGLLKFFEKDLKYMNREKYETVKRSQVLPGDIIITKVGTIGNICFFPNQLKEGVLSTTGSCRFRPNNRKVIAEFLIYNLLYQRPYMKRIASEGVQPFLNMTQIKSIPLIVPPLKKQEKFRDIVNNLNPILNNVKHQMELSTNLFNKTLSSFFS